LRHRRREQGTALVELALVFPMLAMLVFGTIDLGRAYTTYEHMKNAAREAAYLAKDFPNSQFDDPSGVCVAPGDMWDRALQEANSAAGDFQLTVQFGGNTYTSGAGGTQGSLVCNALKGPAPGTPITITVTDEKFALLTPLVEGFVGPVQISATVSVREVR
jgi:hypothetical protein